MAATNKTLVLLCPRCTSSHVATVDSGYETVIGYVERNMDRYLNYSNYGLWSAYGLDRSCHGDRYLDMWCAAKQLALGLGKGDYVR